MNQSQVYICPLPPDPPFLKVRQTFLPSLSYKAKFARGNFVKGTLNSNVFLPIHTEKGF